MKKAKLSFLTIAALSLPMMGYGEPVKKTTSDEARIPAVKLINTSDNHSAFLKGSIPALEKIPARQFWISDSTEEWEKNTHPAPRKQYVVTLQGTLKFKVSDGSTFTIAPGTVLLAEDTQGEGHSWEIVDGDKWVRAYIPITSDKDYFVSDK